MNSFFSEHRKLRACHFLCWRCLKRKPISKCGLCSRCAKNEAQDKKTALLNAEIKERGVDEKSTKVRTGVFDDIEGIWQKVLGLLDKGPLPKISPEQAEQVLMAAQHLSEELSNSDLLKIVNMDCYT